MGLAGISSQPAAQFSRNMRRCAAHRKSRAVVVHAAVGTGTGGKRVDKVVLAYSGGLDTSVILRWLQETYDCEVVTFTADLGQASQESGAIKHAIIE